MKKHPRFCGVTFIENQTINLATEESSFAGRGTRISPDGMEWLMKEFGFVSHEGVIQPESFTDATDRYNRPVDLLDDYQHVRYLMRFVRTDKHARSLSQDLQYGSGIKEPWGSHAMDF